jgi:hypothetical protein
MVRSIFYLTLSCIISVSCISCSDDLVQQDLLNGNWHLKEVLADPGNGSGTYRPVESDQVLRFFSNGILGSTESLCNNNETGGTYDSTRIFPSGCDYSMTYELIEETLYVYPPCIEPCGMKFGRE